jgi:two-component system sensor kinase FixL
MTSSQEAGSATSAAGESAADQGALFQAIYNTAPDAIIVIDRGGIVRAFNAAAERQFGWPASEALGQNVKMLMPSPYREAHDGYIAHYLTTGEARIIGVGRVVVGLRRDGSTFPMELSVDEVETPDGLCFVGFIRDLTERQETEARLQDLQSELTHMSRLTAMGEMASALAHELNQPLSAIANYLTGSRRLIERGELDAKVIGGAIDKASEQALRAGDIIRRLRAFVSPAESERTVERVTKLVEEASALGLVGAKEKDIQVSFRIDPEADLVLADRVQIQQVLVNLIRNAVEAMEGEPRRELVIGSRPADDGMVEITVSDTGSGIAPEMLKNLFQSFFTTKAEGMGVGLSVCRTIVEAHGGQINAEPNPGGGTVFRFTLTDGNEREGGDAA